MLFEPMIVLTNAVFFSICIVAFFRLKRFTHRYGRNMALFLLLTGVSTVFGAVCHAVHYQLGMLFFRVMFYLLNGASLVAVYFCFRGSYSYLSGGTTGSKMVQSLVAIAIAALLVATAMTRQFVFITISAGLAMVFSLVVHIVMNTRNHRRGNMIVVAGWLTSFSSIVVHSLRIGFGEWFNYKDFAHVFMIVGVSVIANGVRRLSLTMEPPATEKAPTRNPA